MQNTIHLMPLSVMPEIQFVPCGCLMTATILDCGHALFKFLKERAAAKILGLLYIFSPQIIIIIIDHPIKFFKMIDLLNWLLLDNMLVTECSLF